MVKQYKYQKMVLYLLCTHQLQHLMIHQRYLGYRHLHRHLL